MGRTADSLGRDLLKQSLADWASRIAAGEVPPAPPRPSGVERNVVITQWAWGQDLSYIHDNVSTDKRDPTLYPDGKVWGIDIGQSYLWALDPVTHTVTSHEVPMRDGPGRDPSRMGRIQGNTSSHNPMLDDQGRVWLTTRIRGRETPAWANEVVVDTAGGSTRQLSARDMSSGRQLGYFDTASEEFVLIDTVYGTHHLQFDSQGRLWTSGDRSRLGMLDPGKLDAKRPAETEAAAQTAWTKIDPETGRSVMGGGYGIIVNPADDTIWRAGYPGIFGQPPLPNLIGNRIDVFDPRTQAYEQYVLPPPAYGPRGIDATTDGKLWFGTGSGHLGRFDPRDRGVHLLGDARAEDPRDRRGNRQRRLPLLHLGRPVRHVRPRPGPGHPDRHQLGLAPGVRPRDRGVHEAPDPVSAGHLHPRARRAHRRPRRGVEGPGTVGVEQHGRAAAHREPDRLHQPHPVATRPAGAVAGCTGVRAGAGGARGKSPAAEFPQGLLRALGRRQPANRRLRLRLPPKPSGPRFA